MLLTSTSERAQSSDEEIPIISTIMTKERENISAMARERLTLGALKVWTIGHSTLAVDEFMARLKSFEIQTLVDVRSFPGSRRYPQFNKEKLRASLLTAGIEYVHLPEIGGRRKAKRDSYNLAWRNESFRGYADYMETEPFRAGIERLV